MIAKTSKDRLDHLLTSRGLVESRERAKALILSGSVLVDGSKIEKVGASVKTDAKINLLQATYPYVSRGGLKLEEALKVFDLDVTGYVAIDVGASTGGFTDCLLKRGAARVYAVDVGYGQLAWPLRRDRRVVVLERQNIRHLSHETVPERVDLVTIDVSFISLEKALPPVIPWVKKGGAIIALVKPQFEVEKGKVGKGGIVRDPGLREATVDKIRRKAREWGLKPMETIPSPIHGQKGNLEYLVYFEVCGNKNMESAGTEARLF